MPQVSRVAIELSVLALGIPLVYGFGFKRLPIHPLILLWIVAAACLVVLLRDERFDRRRMWRAEALAAWWRPILLRFLVLATVMAAMLELLHPELRFDLIRRSPGLWAAIMIGYPFVSVLPQGVIYRLYIPHRLRPLRMPRWAVIAVSAAAFAFVHVIFHNVYAVAFTLVGGAIFVTTQLRTRSLAASCLEHALYGWFIFTSGWGHFFYHGNFMKP